MEIINVQSGIKSFNLEVINIVVNDESIMSIVDETIAENAVEILDTNKEGVEKMVANNAFMIKEMKEKVEKDTRKQDRIEIAKNLMDILDNETIALKTGLTIDQVSELRRADESKTSN